MTIHEQLRPGSRVRIDSAALGKSAQLGASECHGTVLQVTRNKALMLFVPDDGTALYLNTGWIRASANAGEKGAS